MCGHMSRTVFMHFGNYQFDWHWHSSMRNLASTFVYVMVIKAYSIQCHKPNAYTVHRILCCSLWQNMKRMEKHNFLNISRRFLWSDHCFLVLLVFTLFCGCIVCVCVCAEHILHNNIISFSGASYCCDFWLERHFSSVWKLFRYTYLRRGSNSISSLHHKLHKHTQTQKRTELML